MAFVVRNRRGAFEIRESRSTPQGPRSRTLATFDELTDETLEKAQARAEGRLDPEQLRAAALRAGAPVAAPPADRAARALLGGLAKGEPLDPMLKRLLRDALADGARGDRPRDPDGAVSDSARSAGEWIGASSRDRATALLDLLRLGDALPLRRRGETIGYPRLEPVGR